LLKAHGEKKTKTIQSVATLQTVTRRRWTKT